ncbi:MAG: CHRD domain-containing protein [Micrococcus sp.]|nr:CHRD domain-containing protein [Micrococcus sp.]
MKAMTCLHRPAIAGIAALGLTSTVLLAPAAHASSPTSERPGSFTSAYTALLVPSETDPAEAPALLDEAPPADAPGEDAALEDVPVEDVPIEEERSSQVTPAGQAAPAPEEAAGAAATSEAPADTSADTPVSAPQETTAESVPADTGGSGEQEAPGGEAPAVEAPGEAPAEDEATDVAAPAESAGEEAEEATPEEASEETAPAEEPAPAQEQVSGEAALWVNADREVVCFDIDLNGVSGESAATVHLHEAAGAQLLAFSGSSGCLPLSASALAQIDENPNAFYIDVHTEQSPDGAARGFLTQVPLGGVDAGGGGTATQDAALSVAGAAAAAVLLGLGGAFALSRRSRGSA